MPKLQNVTDEQVQATLAAVDDLMHDVNGYADRMEKGYCEPISGGIETVQTINRAIRSLVQLNALIIAKRCIDEQKAELETLLRQRAEA